MKQRRRRLAARHRELALRPDLPPDTLLELALIEPAVLENPALPLVALESPALSALIVERGRAAYAVQEIARLWGRTPAPARAAWLAGCLGRIQPPPTSASYVTRFALEMAHREACTRGGLWAPERIASAVAHAGLGSYRAEREWQLERLRAHAAA